MDNVHVHVYNNVYILFCLVLHLPQFNIIIANETALSLITQVTIIILQVIMTLVFYIVLLCC